MCNIFFTRSSPPGFEGGSFVPKTPPLLDESLDGSSSLLATSFDDNGGGAAEQRPPQQAAVALPFSTGKTCALLQRRSPRNSSRGGLSTPRGRDVVTHTSCSFAPDQLVQSLADAIRQVQELLDESGLRPYVVGAMTLTDGETMVVSRVGPVSASEDGELLLPALSAAEAHNSHSNQGVQPSPPPPPLWFCFGPASALASGLACGSAAVSSAVDSVESGAEESAAPPPSRSLNESFNSVDDDDDHPSSSGNPTSAKKKKKRFKVKNPFKKRKPKSSGSGGGADKVGSGGGASASLSFEDEVEGAALVLRSEAAGGFVPLRGAGDAQAQVICGESVFLAASQQLALNAGEDALASWQWFPVAANVVVWCSRGKPPQAKALASFFPESSGSRAVSFTN